MFSSNHCIDNNKNDTKDSNLFEQCKVIKQWQRNNTLKKDFGKTKLGDNIFIPQVQVTISSISQDNINKFE